MHRKLIFQQKEVRERPILFDQEIPGNCGGKADQMETDQRKIEPKKSKTKNMELLLNSLRRKIFFAGSALEYDCF